MDSCQCALAELANVEVTALAELLFGLDSLLPESQCGRHKVGLHCTNPPGALGNGHLSSRLLALINPMVGTRSACIVQIRGTA